jgi:hypothetical protein
MTRISTELEQTNPDLGNTRHFEIFPAFSGTLLDDSLPLNNSASKRRARVKSITGTIDSACRRQCESYAASSSGSTLSLPFVFFAIR